MRKVFLSILLLALGLAAGCGGGGGTTTSSASTTPSGGSSSGSNVLPIAVNGGPMVNQPNGFTYQNAAFASATICAPGSKSNCVPINNLLVDTGSTGLRVFDSEVSALNLPAVNASNGSAAYDCVSFVDQSYLWGPVQKADVTLGGETASGVPIQVISTSASTTVPSNCSNGGSNDNSVDNLGANGILGIGSEPTDCFYNGSSACDPSAGFSTPPSPAYYTCSGATCNPAFVVKANQVANPVVLLPTDNNGVIVELPSASGNEATMSGSVVFGIGTESNNQLPSSATVFTLAPCDEFTTVFDGQTLSPGNCTNGPGSFIDSGSNGLYFPDVANSINVCSTDPSNEFYDLYCPPSTQSLSATNEGENGESKSTSFSVSNAEDILSNQAFASDAVLPGLDGTQPSGYGFDWGLPFFYGLNVYTSIDGQKMPLGTPAAPWWAY